MVPWLLAVEVLRLEQLRDLDDGVLVDQQRSQDRLLGFDGLRRQAIDGQANAPGSGLGVRGQGGR